MNHKAPFLWILLQFAAALFSSAHAVLKGKKLPFISAQISKCPPLLTDKFHQMSVWEVGQTRARGVGGTRLGDANPSTEPVCLIINQLLGGLSGAQVRPAEKQEWNSKGQAWRVLFSRVLKQVDAAPRLRDAPLNQSGTFPTDQTRSAGSGSISVLINSFPDKELVQAFLGNVVLLRSQLHRGG